MSSPIQFLRKLLAAGVELEAAMLAAEQFEQELNIGLASRRANDAERQRRRRSRSEHNVNHVMSRDTRDERDPSLSPPSPEPPSTTNLSSKPPYSPPKADELAERIWALQPAKHRRSTRPDVRAAISAALKRGADPESLFGALQRYYRLPDCTKDEGKFAKAAHRVIANDRWRDFLPAPDPPARPVDAAVLAHRAQHFRDTGEWKPAWGDPPKDLAA